MTVFKLVVDVVSRKIVSLTRGFYAFGIRTIHNFSHNKSLYRLLHFSGAQEWHKHQGEAPMTKTKGDGSASRNITRKTNHG